MPKAIEKRVYSTTHTKREEDSPALAAGKIVGGSGEGASKRQRIARRAAKELLDGMYANLGIGLPMAVADFVDPSIEAQSQRKNGIIGLGLYPVEGSKDTDLINAGKETVILKLRAAPFGSEESFGMIHSGRINLTLLRAM